ncbi:endolytic transglycosylase MltG [Paenibacillus hexagrammi]|uniref:Endolytic transglycosylase MltG n=1 Tax=Paenibacillus hexagrammi TaxID=2908839 RepID=A0ABY3SQV1_9BACL|nr:endolytic transglycosylase MltG [Paenibacillus sp. YPD9-1]UJF35371.1 endolytic transglycosylase MltG [Paenibacillus sp. YPD9-1]
MFKNRSYMYGIGTGIIVGAILLEMMTISQRPTPAQESAPIEEMEPQKLKEQASKFYQVYEKDEKLYTQADFDASVQKRVQDELAKQPAATNPSAQPQAQPAPVSRVVVYVQPNLDATAVGELLLNSGVISDRKAFAAELEKQGGSYKIQIGYHQFQGTLTMEDVVKNLITSQTAD